MKTTNSGLGKSAEDYASAYLVGCGYEILCRNYRTKQGEIDIIAKHGNVLCVVEVKARSSLYFGNPEQAVTVKKRQRIQQVAHKYVIDNDIDAEVRFDIITITKQQGKLQILQHIQDAFKIY